MLIVKGARRKRSPRWWRVSPTFLRAAPRERTLFDGGGYKTSGAVKHGVMDWSVAPPGQLMLIQVDGRDAAGKRSNKKWSSRTH